MPNFGPYESEVAFISGVTDANTAAAVSYYTMESLQGPDGKWSVVVPTVYTYLVSRTPHLVALQRDALVPESAVAAGG